MRFMDACRRGGYMTLPLPEDIREIIGEREYAIDPTGMSDSNVLCFDNVVLKIEKQSEESDNEHRMLRWLQGRLPVPEVVCYEKMNGFNYLLMTRIDGVMACDESCLKRPNALIRCLAEGLKMLRAVDISNCPYRNDLENKFRLAKYRIDNNLITTEDFEPDTIGGNGFKSPMELLDWLIGNKPEEQFVFSHGDYCLPNVFLKKDSISGFIDLGRAGIADFWQDIALCLRSIRHNLGLEGFEKQLFNELGIEPDFEKIRYYILLDELF
jgi:kanamycin kinase/aminoglycoside 3'-phosphotransferase-3